MTDRIGYTREDIADQLGVSVSLLRKYERLARRLDVLDTPAGERGQGVALQYTAHDVDVFRTVHQLRRQQHSYEDMADGLLVQALASDTQHVVTEDQPSGRPDKDAERALVPLSQFMNIVSQYAAKLDEQSERLIAAERQAAAGAAIAEERDRLLTRVAKLEQQLEEERRSWWQRLFRRRPTPAGGEGQ